MGGTRLRRVIAGGLGRRGLLAGGVLTRAVSGYYRRLSLDRNATTLALYGMFRGLWGVWGRV